MWAALLACLGQTYSASPTIEAFVHSPQLAGRKEILRVESVYASRTIIEIQGPSLGAAMVFVVLVGLASSLDALLTWRCYLTGRSIRAEDAPLAKWKSVLVHICKFKVPCLTHI